MANLPAQGQKPWGDLLNQQFDLWEGRLDAQDQKLLEIQDTATAPADTQVAEFVQDSQSATHAELVEFVDTKVVANVTRVVHNGTNYPARPAGAEYVEWVGPTEPLVTQRLDNDTWVITS